MEVYRKSTLSSELIDQITTLTRLVWPPPAGEDLAVHRDRYAAVNSSVFNEVFIIREGGRVVAHTEVFARDVFTGGRTLRNLALAGVCVHPDYRGRNWGAAMVRQAFAYVDNGDFDCCLFQTRVPAFYDKLGARLVDNAFVNSHSERPDERPWWDPYAMLYPAGFPLGAARVDLNGGGY